MDIRHIAFIPDGNRRYARKRGISYSNAYSKGFEKAREVMLEWKDFFKDRGIDKLTFWALSTENLNRNKLELGIIFSKMREFMKDALSNIDEYGIRARFLGRLYLLPVDIQDLMKDIMERTKGFNGFEVNIAVAYGGRAELMDAFKSLSKSGLEYNEENLKKFLYLKDDPDLIVRTGGTLRSSGFMPWQAAYSEWYFSEKLWPEFDKTEMDKAIEDYLLRERRFGL